MKYRSTPHVAVRTSRVFTIWMILMLAFAMLPVTDAAAQGDGTPESEETGEEALDQQTAGVVEFLGEKRLCPPGYDLATADPGAADTDCGSPLGGITFTITTDDQNYAPGNRSSDGQSGQFSWNDIPATASYQVAEVPPEGYGEPYADCSYYTDPDGAPAQRNFGPAPDGLTAQVQASSGFQLVRCTFYNVPVEDGATIDIQKYLCPPGYAPENPTVSDYFDDCVTPHQGASFSLQPDLANPQQTNGNGQTSFENVATTGTVGVREAKSDAYVLAAVYCQPQPDAPNGVSYDDSDAQPIDEEPSAYLVQVDVEAGESAECAWFNVPIAEGAQVFISKFLCPPELDAKGGTLGDFTSCDPHQGATFRIPFDTTGAEGTSDSNGELVLGGIPYGSIELQETTTTEYDAVRAYCYAATPEDGGSGLSDDDEVTISFPEAGRATITFDIPEGNNLYCYIFNQAFADGDEETGTVSVTKYICPVEYDQVTDNLDGLLDNCTTLHEGAGVNLIKPGFGLFGGETDASGEMTWEDFPSGPITLRELTEGYALVRVYCHGVPADQQNSVIDEYDEALIYRDGEFYHADGHLEPGYVLHCYLFNVPVDDFGTVYIYKYTCHEDFEVEGASREDLETNCTQPHENINFGVGSESGEYQEEQQTDTSGMATWEDVPAGGIGILEGEHEGYELVGVYCGVTIQNASTLPTTWEEVPYQDGLEYDLPPGEYLHCVFYNAPSNDGTIVITKYLCGLLQLAVDGGGPSYEIFSQQCTDLGVGYVYTLQTEGGDLPGESDSSGRWEWTDLDPGPVTVSETLPTGYDSYAVYCATDPGGPYEEYAGEQDLDFEYTVAAGETLYCSWFNYVPNSNTQVEIVKYLCPEAYDYEAADYTALSGACTETIDGVSFTIFNEDGYYSQETTSNGGAAEWNSVPASTVSMQELPDGPYRPVKVYCSQTPNENAQPEPFQGHDLDAEDAFIQIGVTEEYTLICHWFNIPEPTGGQVIVYKWICDPFFTRGEAGYQDFLDNCQEPGYDFTFLLKDSGGDTVDQETTASGGNGTVVLVAPEPFIYRVEEEPHPDYITLAVYCTDDQSVDPTTDLGPSPELELDELVTYYCYWFNAPYEDPGYDPGSIVIHKFNCPPGYPTEPQGGRSPNNWFFSGCTQVAPGVTFNVEQGGNTVGSGATDDTGTAVITGVAAGSARISELPREGYGPPKIFCASYPVTGPTVLFSYDEQTVDNWGHTYELVQDEVLECFWFNFPNSQGEDGQPIQIIIHKYLCEEGYEYSGQDYPAIAADCTAAEEGINFDVTGGDAATSGGPTDLNGYAEYNGVAPGSILLSETPREGYQTLAIYCTQYTSTAGDPTPYTHEQGQLSWYLAPGYTFECYWFNAPVEDYGHITIDKYSCHEAYDHEPATREELADNCVEPHGEVMFNLGGPDGYSTDLQTDTAGHAEWLDLEPGAYILTETPPEGYYPVRIYCTVYPFDGPHPSDPAYTGTWEDYTDSPDNILDINLDVETGFWIYCVWYNAPTDDHGWVDVVKYVCPADYDYAAKSHEVLREECDYLAHGIDFTVQAGNYDELRTTDAEGHASWEEVPAGTLSLSESAEGLQGVRVLCTSVEGEGEPPAPPWTDYTPSPAIEADLQSGYHLYCDWFNIPEDEYGYILIFKYNCSQEYDYHTRDEFFADCTERVADVEYDVTGLNNYAERVTTDQEGYASAPNVPVGEVTIREYPPDGYVPWRVFCGLSSAGYIPPTTWEDTAIETGYAITTDLEEPYFLLCEWYNVPYEEDPPQVWIQKYNCPEEADWHWNYHEFLAGCHDAGANVEYGIGPDENSLSLSVTDSSGRIQLGDLDPGAIAIQESLPQGYAGFVVYCQFTTPTHTGNYQRAEVYDRTVKLELDYGYVVTCVWFNLPPGHEPPEESPPAGGHQPLQPVFPTSGGGTSGSGTSGGGTGNGTSGLPPVDPATPATLIITKYTCESGYDVHAEESDPAVDCDTLTDDIPFALTNESADDPVDLQGTTGDDGEGTVAFNDLAAGPYLLTETLPEGTISAFIYTCESDRREFQVENPFTPFAYAGPDGRIGVTLVPGETLECDWYDVPEEAAGGTVTVIKYACPGTSVIVAQCVIYPDGATIGLFPVGDSGDTGDTDEPGEIIELTTGEDGTATAQVQGTYTVQELPTTACLIDSEAFDVEGNLVVNEGDVVEILVYNCGLET